MAEADVVLVAVPGAAIAEAFDRLTGGGGQDSDRCDQPDRCKDAPDGIRLECRVLWSPGTAAPTAKSLNESDFASLLGRLGEARVRPSNLWCGDEERRSRGAAQPRRGIRPRLHGQLANAARQESIIDVIFAIGEGDGCGSVYRFAPMAQLWDRPQGSIMTRTYALRCWRAPAVSPSTVFIASSVGSPRPSASPQVKVLLIAQEVDRFHLERFTDHGEHVADTLHETLDDAMHQAYSEFDAISDWRLCPDDADPLQYIRGNQADGARHAGMGIL